VEKPQLTKVNTNRLVIADTCFWIALYDRTDQHHREAAAIMDRPAMGTFLFPWPLHYELLRTRFVRRPGWVEAFLTVVKLGRIKSIDDATYRENALQLTTDWAAKGKRSISLVDMVIRLVLEDQSQRINGMVTFNAGDFADICQSRGIRIYPSPR
jgi:predicted nucleic acid-binding protein